MLSHFDSKIFGMSWCFVIRDRVGFWRNFWFVKYTIINWASFDILYKMYSPELYNVLCDMCCVIIMFTQCTRCTSYKYTWIYFLNRYGKSIFNIFILFKAHLITPIIVALFCCSQIQLTLSLPRPPNTLYHCPIFQNRGLTVAALCESIFCKFCIDFILFWCHSKLLVYMEHRDS